MMWRGFAYVTDFLSRKLIFSTGAPGVEKKEATKTGRGKRVDTGKVQMIGNLIQMDTKFYWANVVNGQETTRITALWLLERYILLRISFGNKMMHII